MGAGYGGEASFKLSYASFLCYMWVVDVITNLAQICRVSDLHLFLADPDSGSEIFADLDQDPRSENLRVRTQRLIFFPEISVL